MSTKGLFIPLSVIKGDTLNVAFDISLNSTLLLPTEITLEGQFVSNTDDTTPEPFTFVNSENETNKIHAIIDSSITEGLKVGEYTYQIRFKHLVDFSESIDTTGFYTTILYGSLSVLFSPLQ
jgi:invasion protein IalB